MSKGVFLGLIGFGAYSLMDLNHKHSISILKIDFFTYIFYMILVAAIILTIIGLAQGGFKVFFQIPKGVGKFIFLRAVIATMGVPGSIAALSMLPMHIYYPIVLLAPILATVFSCLFLGEKFSKEQFLVILLAFIGVLLVTKPWQINSFSPEYTWGLIISILVMFGMVIISIISRIGLSRVSATVATWYGAWFMFILALIYHLLGFAPIVTPSIEQVPSFLLGGFFYSMGLVLYTKAYGIGPIKKVAPTNYTQLMWGVLFDMVFFKSYTTLLEVIGILIIAGVNLLNLYRKS